MLSFILLLSLTISPSLYSMKEEKQPDKNLQNSAIVANALQALANDIREVDPDNHLLPAFNKHIQKIRSLPMSTQKKEQFLRRTVNNHEEWVQEYVAATRNPHFEYEQSNKRRRLK